MVQGVGSSGSGSISNLTEYQVYYPMYQEYLAESESGMSFDSWLMMTGYVHNFTQQVENRIEGVDGTGDGINGNNISTSRSVSNGTSAIYQSADEDNAYEIDFDTGRYKVLKNKKDIAEALGLSGDTNYDVIKFEYQKVEMTDYTFGNLGDGQDSTNSTVADAKFGNLSLKKQEFDMDYILNALLMNPSDPQYIIAKDIFDDLCEHLNQWLPASDQKDLDDIAKEEGTNSVAYKAKLKELIRLNLDQAREWVDNHNHVKPTGSGQLTPEAPKDTESEENAKGTKPEYNLDKILSNTGLSGLYTGNSNYYGARHYNNKTCEQSSINDARQYVDEQLTKVMDEMISQLGDSCTAEMKDYMYAAKAAIVGSSANSHGQSNWGGVVTGVLAGIAAAVGTVLTAGALAPVAAGAIAGGVFAGTSVTAAGAAAIGLGAAGAIGGTAGAFAKIDSEGLIATASEIDGIINAKTFGGGLFSDWGAQAEVNVKKMVDEFTKLFDYLCVNKGKSPAQVKAEEKAAEEKKTKETAAYKSLYGMDFKASAKSAGVDPSKTLSIGNLNTAAEVRARANTEILAPLKAKIREQLAGQGIADSELQTALDNAGNAALSDCTEWASTSDNFSYTINTSRLIDMFKSNVQQVIKNRGYEF